MLWRQVVSQSPATETDIARAKDPAINQRMKHGGTLSGHEPNCAFLNTGGGPMATVSAVTGFDYADDARGLAVCDWDDDGDLDVWVSNRTGPRIRYLRNDVPTKRFVSFRLQGTTCNRDAIGARLEVALAGDAPRTLIKSLRAGEGFLSQSAKTLHVGLPAGATIEHVSVRWPGGDRQGFGKLAPGRRYLLIEGKAAAVVEQMVSRAGRARPAEQSVSSDSQRARIALGSLIPVPRLPYLPFGQEDLPADAPPRDARDGNRPTLVNLWATWCGPCLQELAEFAKHSQQVRASNLRIVAVCVDPHIGENPAAMDARELIERLAFPFESGMADSKLVDRLQQIHDLPFASENPMPVPVSFLLTPDGQVAFIYRGPVDLDQLLVDVRAVQQPAFQRQAKMAVAGRWNRLPAETDILPIPRALLASEQISDALEYVRANHDRLRDNPDYAKLLVWLGDELIKQRIYEEALRQYRVALRVAPDNVAAMNNYAWQLATLSDPGLRDPTEAVRWARRAAELTGAADAGVLDTLGEALQSAGRVEQAQAVWKRAIAVAEKQGNQALANRLRGRLAQTSAN